MVNNFQQGSVNYATFCTSAPIRRTGPESGWLKTALETEKTPSLPLLTVGLRGSSLYKKDKKTVLRCSTAAQVLLK